MPASNQLLTNDYLETGHAMECNGIKILHIPYPSKFSIPYLKIFHSILFYTKNLPFHSILYYKSCIPYSIPFPYFVLYLKNPELYTM